MALTREESMCYSESGRKALGAQNLTFSIHSFVEVRDRTALEMYGYILKKKKKVLNKDGDRCHKKRSRFKHTQNFRFTGHMPVILDLPSLSKTVIFFQVRPLPLVLVELPF